MTVYQRECYTGLQISLENGRKYTLRNSNNDEKRKKQTVIDKLNIMTASLVNALKQSEHRHMITVKRLIDNWRGSIDELEPYAKEGILAYNVNKGEKINICLTDPITDKTIDDNINTLFFIIMHELAHVMTKEYDHNAEFWENFRFLIKFSDEKGVYKYVNYKDDPEHICGTIIASTPYIK
jgi:hypothetical protein